MFQDFRAELGTYVEGKYFFIFLLNFELFSSRSYCKALVCIHFLLHDFNGKNHAVNRKLKYLVIFNTPIWGFRLLSFESAWDLVYP